MNEIMMEAIGITKKPDSITELLQEEILSGRIAPGEELTQNELAQALGVSRMPVREALIVLEYRGILERLPNNHVRVVEITRKTYADIFHICERLESQTLAGEEATELFHADDEVNYHRRRYRALPAGFIRKNLQIMIEVYVQYAVRKSEDSAKKRRELLVQGELKRYYEELLQTIKE